MRIGFIGLGKLGMECAEVMAKAGHHVQGYDIAPRESKSVQMVGSIREVTLGKKIVFVAVPTPHEKKYDGTIPVKDLRPMDFDYVALRQVIQDADDCMNKSQALVIISTVLPGTIRGGYGKFGICHLVRTAELIYNPYLIAMGSTEWDMKHPEMMIIGTENGDRTPNVEKLIALYDSIVEDTPRYETGTWEEAEAIKIFYNTFISAKLAIVNMIQDVAVTLGNMNVDVVTKALSKSTQRITGPAYMTAGAPDGGPCHPRDNIALRYLNEKLELPYDLFDAISNARDYQVKRIALTASHYAAKISAPIVIVGKAYKPGVPLVDGSGGLLVKYYLDEQRELKLLTEEVFFLDAATDDYPPEEVVIGPCVYLLMHNVEITYRNLPPVLKNSFTQSRIMPAPGSVIIDMWRRQEKLEGCEVVHYGNTRKL